MEKKKVRKAPRKVDEDWEALKKAFREAGKKQGKGFIGTGKTKFSTRLIRKLKK